MKVRFFTFLLASIFISFAFVPALKSQTLDQRITSIINKMTTQEKILQMSQEGSFNTADNERLNIPGFIMSDGPHGVRYGQATAFPVGIAMAATWDPELIYRVGVAMGQEFRGKGKSQALGPCMDITRDPRNGRSPESGGEDPYLCANITSSLIKGIQSTGCIATAKHFNGVNSQNDRHNNKDIVTQEQLMDEYGLNFRSAVQKAGVLSVMNAYNFINGNKCAENKNLLTEILRNRWGYPFYVVSDWGSIWNTAKAVQAGCNICMGADNYKNDLPDLVANGTIQVSLLNDAVGEILRTKFLSGMMGYYPPGSGNDINSKTHQELALKAAKKSIVLLKNKDGILPLNKDTVSSIAVIGPSAAVAQLDGTGSSYVTPFYSVSPLNGIINKIGNDKVYYAKGCDINSNDTSGFASAVSTAKKAGTVIFFGGLDDTQEGEGRDRINGSIDLPGRQQALIYRLSQVNKNIIVVLESGGICGINLSFDYIKGLIYAFYPGQEGGSALADVIFGDYNPGGKLPVTMPVSDMQLPVRNNDFTDDYGCGYRWFDKMGYTPQYPFGYGLSYTTFQFSNITLSSSSIPEGQEIYVSADVTNTGTREGEEVAELYLSHNNSNLEMPAKQLKGFKRISLNPGETKTVTFTITNDELYYFDENADAYKVDPGQYTVKIGGSSDELPLQADFNITPAQEKPDLKIAHIRWFPRYPVEGDSVVFLADILNQGTGASAGGTVHEVVFKVNGKEVSTANEFSGIIPAGGMKMVCANVGPEVINSWITSKHGKFEVEAEVDPSNKIDECIETNNSALDTITVYSEPPVNLALGKPVIVSSVEAAGLEGSNAVDGNLNTRWSTQFSDPQYLYVDLGEVKHFNMIVLRWEAAYASKYSIRVSNDASNWTELKMISGSGGTEQIDVSADARYVEMFGTKRATEWGYSLYEFEVYNATDTSGTTGIQSQINGSLKPDAYSLEDCYPNPFNPSTTISYDIPEQSKVTLKIYDLLGREVAVLVDKEQPAGKYVVQFAVGNLQLASGVYIYRLTAGKYSSVKKMVLLK